MSKKSNPEKMTGKETTEAFVLKDSITVEGVTADYVWYEAKQLRDAMNTWGWRFDKLVSVMEARHKDNNLAMSQLLIENNNLKAKLKQLKGESK